MAKAKIPAKHAADAAIKAAKANHYLVGLVSPDHSQPLLLDFETANDANQILIDAENSGKITANQYDIASHLLVGAMKRGQKAGMD